RFSEVVQKHFIADGGQPAGKRRRWLVESCPPSQQLQRSPQHCTSRALGWVIDCALVQVKAGVKQVHQFARNVSAILVGHQRNGRPQTPSVERILAALWNRPPLTGVLKLVGSSVPSH